MAFVTSFVKFHLLITLLATCCIRGCILKPTRFRTNNLRNPLAIVSNKPVFSWALGFSNGEYEPPLDEVGIDRYQSAYRLICTDDIKDSNSVDDDNAATETANILWDSGKIYSQQTLQIEYNGTVPLKSLQRVRWKVHVWDQNDDECIGISDNEAPWFETGLLSEESWGGSEWIARFGPLSPNTDLCSLMAENDENSAPRFRTIMETVPPSVVAARAYISGLGYYQLYINGEKVGDAILDPGLTTYSKRVLYSAYDVTSLLGVNPSDTALQSPSRHAVGVELGNGWWNSLPLLFWGGLNIRTSLVVKQNITSTRPMFRLLVVGFKSDGSTISLLKSTSGPSSGWLTAGSPTTFNNIYLGEKYDARLEPAFDEWKTTSYIPNSAKQGPNTVVWKAPVKADSRGIGKLEAQEVPPIRRQKMLKAKPLSQRAGSNGTTVKVFDTGVNHAGSCQIKVKPPATTSGTTIQFRYGELLNYDGSLNGLTSTAGHMTKIYPNAPTCQPEFAYQQDILTTGTRSVDWTPSWSWHGFRYIEVTLPPQLSFDDINLELRCCTMRTDVDLVATFDSHDDWLAEVRGLVRNTYDSNMMSIQSDCPHRERFGYGGDVLGCGEAGLSIYDFSAFYRKRVLDFNDAQVKSPSGKLSGFTETSPFVGIQSANLGPGTGPIGWETFQPEALLWLYKYYGDTRTMKESFENTKAYIELLDSEPSGIEHGLGDWLAVDPTNVSFTGRGFQHMSYLAFANITEILGMPAVAARYRQKAAKIVRYVNDRFLDINGAYKVATRKSSTNVTQTGQAMALFHGFILNDASSKRDALKQLEANIRSSSYLTGACKVQDYSKVSPQCKDARGGSGPHMTAGLFGIKWLLMALADGGLNDLAYDIVSTKTYPGLRWMTNNPFANATTIWEAFAFSDAAKSHNHPMFGSTEVWLLQSVAGIQPHPFARGMDHILIRPNPPSQLQHATASFESPRGVITVSWKRSPADGFKLCVTIPPNCRATVHVPAERSTAIYHNGALVLGLRWAPSVVNQNQGSYVTGMGSGRHEFRSVPGDAAVG